MIDLIIILLSIPIGFLISWLARDELIEGHKYIKLLFFVSFILMTFFSFYDEVLTKTTGFVCIVSFISVIKRFDKRWAVERKR
jgi:Ca2+/H+ antiporter